LFGSLHPAFAFFSVLGLCGAQVYVDAVATAAAACERALEALQQEMLGTAAAAAAAVDPSRAT
jgi:hypothetical protein